MTELNKKLLVDVINRLIKEPEIHVQSVWARGVVTDEEVAVTNILGTTVPMKIVSCGTAQCVAGETCLMMGDRFVLEPWNPIAPGQVSRVDRVLPLGSSEMLSVRKRAQELLGLSFGAADVLFDSGNSLADVREIVSLLLAGESVGQWLVGQLDTPDDQVELLPEVV